MVSMPSRWPADALAQALAQTQTVGARNHIRVAAGGLRDDQADGFRRIIRLCCKCVACSGQQGGYENAGACHATLLRMLRVIETVNCDVAAT